MTNDLIHTFPPLRSLEEHALKIEIMLCFSENVTVTTCLAVLKSTPLTLPTLTNSSGQFNAKKEIKCIHPKDNCECPHF